MIAEFLSAQKDLLAQAEERLEQYQDKMDRLKHDLLVAGNALAKIDR